MAEDIRKQIIKNLVDAWDSKALDQLIVDIRTAIRNADAEAGRPMTVEEAARRGYYGD